MNVVTVLHNKAMEFADEALLAKMEGNEEASVKFFQKAFALEKEAFDSVQEDLEDLLPKYILIRSAASLALNCGDFREAERLIELGLSMGVPKSVMHELEDLKEQLAAAKAKKESHLKHDTIQLIGIIIDANAQSSEITVQNLENMRLYTILVPQDLLNEVIKSYWADKVQIQAAKSSGGMLLTQINKAA